MATVARSDSARAVVGEHRRARLWRLGWRSWPGLARRALAEAARDRVTMVAASLAFHAFLALVPILLAAVGLLGLVGLSPGTLHSLVHATRVLLPVQMADILNQQLTGSVSQRITTPEIALALAVALWSSVEAMSALQVALDVAYEVPRDRGFVGRRLVALPLLAVTLVLGGVASILLVLGRPIAELVPTGVASVLTPARYGTSALLVILLLSALYSLAPARSPLRWEWISPGGVFATAGWIGAALGYSYYLDHFAHESRTYGALAGAAVTLLWMFLTAVLVLLGAELNRELERVEERSSAGH